MMFNFSRSSDVNFEKRDYDEFIAYGQSKTANVLFSVGLTKKFANDGVVSNAVMPGAIMTNLQRHMTKEEWIKRGWSDQDGKLLFKLKSVEAGAATSVWAAISTDLEGKGGLYLENCQVSKEETSVSEIFKHMFGYLPHAVDQQAADNLWTFSEELLKKHQPK